MLPTSGQTRVDDKEGTMSIRVSTPPSTSLRCAWGNVVVTGALLALLSACGPSPVGGEREPCDGTACDPGLMCFSGLCVRAAVEPDPLPAVEPDSTPDAGLLDAGAGDAGVVDAGHDAGVDAGVDAGFDAGLPPEPQNLRIEGDVVITSAADFARLHQVTYISGDLRIFHTDLVDVPPLFLEDIGGSLVVQSNPSLVSLAGFAGLAQVSGAIVISDNAVLSNLDGLGDLTLAAGGITLADNPLLANLDGLAALTETSSLTVTRNKALQLLHLPQLEAVNTVVQVMQNAGLQSISLPALEAGGNTLRITQNQVLVSVDIPLLVSVNQDIELMQNPALTSLNADALRSVGRHMVVRFVHLDDVAFPLLETVGGNLHLNDLDAAMLTFPSLHSIGLGFQVWRNTTLLDFAFPALFYIGGTTHVRDNPTLPQCHVDDLRTQVDERGGLVNFQSANNDVDGVCLPPDAGVIDAGVTDAGVADAG